MPVRRALVESAVLSLQDQSFFYPYCKGCFSKVDVQQQGTNRVVCSRCGAWSVREQVHYRYRLALKVTRDTHIFTVTVFGTCLDPFFGIPASGLQRLLEDPAEPIGVQTRFRLLGQAVEDCFIGRHFIFGIKATDLEKGPLFRGRQEGPAAVGFSCKESLHYIATQITLPKATAHCGCSVISYYRALLQKVSEGPLEGTGPWTVSRPLILLRQSPTSFDTTLPGSCLLSQSLKRSLDDANTLNRPAWRQSFSLITSSAEQEQEESCRTQGNVGEPVCRQNDSQRSQNLVRGSGCWENHGATEQRVLSPPRSFCENFWTGWSFTASPVSPIQQAGGKTPILHYWSSPAGPGLGQAAPLRDKGSAGRQNLEPNHVPCLGSVAWEDMPFSESLGEFLCDEIGELHRIGKTEAGPTSITPPGREMAAEYRSPGNPSSTVKSSTETDTHRQNNTSSSDVDSYRGTLLNITSTAGLSYGVDFTSNSIGQTYSNIDWNVSDNGQLCPPVNKETGCASTQKCDGDGEEQIGLPDREGVYDCSADLFDTSLVMDMNMQTADSDVYAEPKVQTTTACSETPARVPSRKVSHRGPHPTQLRLDTQAPKDGQKATRGLVLSEPSNTWVQHFNRHDIQDINSYKGSALAQKEYSNLRVTQDFNNSEKDTTYKEQCEDSVSLDFIPPSQSTPLVSKAVPARLPARVKRNRLLGKPDSRDKIESSGPCVSNLTPIRRGGNDDRTKIISPFWKSDKLGSDSQHLFSVQQAERAWESATAVKPVQAPLALHNMKLKQRRPLSRHSTVRRLRVNKSLCNTSVCDKNVHDMSEGYGVDDELLVPPTTVKNRDELKYRKRGQTDNCFRDITSPLVNCKRALLYRSVTPRGPKSRPVCQRQTREHICTQPNDGEGTSLGPNTSVNEVSIAASISSAACADTEGCDWSRDLFSDSF